MNKILSLTFAIAVSLAALAQDSGTAQIAGKWQMSMDTPHGVLKGPFQVQQDGAKLSATFETEMFGTMSATGSVEGRKVSFRIRVPNGPQGFAFSGTVDGPKMSGKTEMDGAWSASGDTAQIAPKKTVLGTVADFRVDSLEMGVKSDDGRTVWVKFGAETDVLLAAPGDKDLSHALPAKITDVAREDRVMVSFVAGMTEARRIVAISATAIARRDAAERLDWQTRGLSGVVAAWDGDEIVLETRTPEGAQRTTVVVGPKTAIRRYAPDSVKFSEAEPATLAQIAIGDQMRTRGDRSEDGARLMAGDVVFGTFVTTLGTVAEVDREKAEMKILDLTSKRPLVVRLTADTQMKKMPDPREMMSGHAEHPPAGLAQMLQQLPAGGFDDLKVGSSVVVTSTRGATPARVTGIMVIANVGAIRKMAQAQAEGASPMEALNRMHGGMLGGPGGLSLPAILQ